MKLSLNRIPVFAFLLSGAMCAPEGAHGKALNLSRDLVADNIASENMTPNTPSLDAGPLLQAGIAYAFANHISTVVADRGSYYFLSLFSPYQHIFLQGISNVTVDLKYSDLYFAQANIMAIDVNDCSNLVLKNFSIDYLPSQSPYSQLVSHLPFTELTVTGVNMSASPPTVSFAPFGSYPLPSTFNSLTVPAGYINDGYFAYVFRGGKPLASTGRMGVVGPLNDSFIQLAATEPWTSNSELSTIEPGDTLVLEWRAGIGSIYASGCTGLTLQGVSVYASGFIGIFSNLGTNITVDHSQVIARPGTDRLISSNADGIHLAKAGEGNALTNDTVKRTCDDAVAMDGQWFAIIAAPSSGATALVTLNNSGGLVVGDAYDFINIDDATISGTATILTESAPDANGVITLTLSQAIPGLEAGFGVTPNDPAFRGSGTLISGNLAQEIVFGRGIYPAGVANVSINDNVTEFTNRSGIVVEQDEGLTYNYKTGPSSGITIANNIVDNALAYGVPSAPVLTDGAGITITAEDKYFNWVTTQSLTNISVANNWVTNCIRTGVRMENVSGGEDVGNALLNCGTAPDSAVWFLPAGETLAQIEADFAQADLVIHSTGVTQSGDITSGPLVANQSFADGSYRFAPESIVVARGHGLAKRTEAANGISLPRSLAGVKVSVKDSAGVSRLADLYYASPTEVTYVVPAETAPGVAIVTIGTQASGALISSAAPGLFSADSTGSGVALATAVRTESSGKQVSEAVYESSPAVAAVPLNLGKPSDSVVVTFEGTGIRGKSTLDNMVVEVAGDPLKVESAGKLSGAAPGMDFVAVRIPHSLAGSGQVSVFLTVDGFTSNAVSIDIK